MQLKKEMPLMAFLLLMFISSTVLYRYVPEKIPTHWNAKGEIDGYSGKFLGLFLLPIIASILYILFLVLPAIMPYRNNIEKIEGKFYWLKAIMLAFFAVLYLASILSSFGIQINIIYVMMPSLAVIFYYIGYLMKYTKRNFFIGIRTPWTLVSDKSWDMTHKKASVLFRFYGLLIMTTLFFPSYAFLFLLISLIPLILYLVVYSYLIYRGEKKKAGRSFR